MPVTIGTNIDALQAQRHLGRATASLSRVFQRLSSGLRINRASDDAAGLSIATRLNTDAKIYGQAIRNANDGISAISIAEGALKELSSLTIRIVELAEQAANGAYSTIQRRANDLEAQSLSNEYTRIVNTTTFNDISLLGAVSGTISLQIGADSSSASRLDVQLDTPLVRGVGDGTLAAPVGLTVAANSSGSYEIGDINEDGRSDILFYSSAGFIGHLMGNGDGTFNAFATFTTGYTHGGNEPIELVDMNQDGHLDVVTASTGDVVVTLGNGDGTFKSGVSYAGVAFGNGIIAKDFNGDGVNDIATMAPDITGNLRVYLNNGSGILSAATVYATGLGGRQIAAGDLTGDGIVDIYSTLSGLVYIGNGNGTFKLGQTFDTGGINRGLNLVDLNNDGNLDILTGDSSSSIGVRLGNGNGSFKALTTYASGSMLGSLNGVETGDFNGDGFLDVATSNGGSGSVSLLVNNGEGSFKAHAQFAAVTNSQNLAVGDLNGDGVCDVVTENYPSAAVNVLFTNATLVAGLPVFSLRTVTGAKTALDQMRSAVQSISIGLGKLGAYQSRVETSLTNVQVIRENLLASASQIMDTELEVDSATVVRLNILQQAGVAVLAQANLGPALALRLLREGIGD